MTGSDSSLAASLSSNIGVTLDPTSFVAPTTFTYAEIKVSTHSPTLSPEVMTFPPKSPSKKHTREELTKHMTAQI